MTSAKFWDFFFILTSGSGRLRGIYEWAPSQIAHSANIAGEEKEGDAADAVAASAVAGNGTTAAATMMQGSGIRQKSAFAQKGTQV